MQSPEPQLPGTGRRAEATSFPAEKHEPERGGFRTKGQGTPLAKGFPADWEAAQASLQARGPSLGRPALPLVGLRAVSLS